MTYGEIWEAWKPRALAAGYSESEATAVHPRWRALGKRFAAVGGK